MLGLSLQDRIVNNQLQSITDVTDAIVQIQNLVDQLAKLVDQRDFEMEVSPDALEMETSTESKKTG